MAAIAAGADGLFIETHPDPAHAKSDGATMLRLDFWKTLAEAGEIEKSRYLDWWLTVGRVGS